MVSAAEVRRIAARVAGVADESQPQSLAFGANGKGVAWTYLVRTAPKAKRLPQLDVLAVRCPIDRKAMLIEAAPQIYFDDAHYRGYPAVLVRLNEISKAELKALLESAVALTPVKKFKRAPRAMGVTRKKAKSG
jgi:hypothetical protein